MSSCSSLTYPLCQGPMEIRHADVHQAPLLHRDKDFRDGIVKQSVCTSRMEIQQPIQSGAWEPLSHQRDQGFRDPCFTEVTLAEDCEHVLHPRPGSLPKHVFSPQSGEVLVNGCSNVPIGQQC